MGHSVGAALAQLMSHRLTTPINYLNQCWLIIRIVVWHSHESNYKRSAHELNLMCLEITPLIAKFMGPTPGADRTQVGSRLALWTLLSGTLLPHLLMANESGLILRMCLANERQRYNVTSSLIGWVHAKNDAWWVKWNGNWTVVGEMCLCSFALHCHLSNHCMRISHYTMGCSQTAATGEFTGLDK